MSYRTRHHQATTYLKNESNKATKQLIELFNIQANQYRYPSIQQMVLVNRVPPKRVRKELEHVPAVEVEYYQTEEERPGKIISKYK